MTNWVCFDKTGTLTEDFMDFNCLVLCDNGKFQEPIINSHDELLQTTTSATNANLTKNKHLNSIIIKNDQKGQINLALNNMAMNHTIVYVE